MPSAGEAIASARKKLASAIKRILKKYDLELRTCGTKQQWLEEGKFDSGSGHWADPGIATKPPRWIIWLITEGGKVKAVLPGGHGSDRIGYFNLRGGNTGAILIRIIPAIRRPNGKFDLREDWEWSVLFCFSPPLRAGTSGDAIDINEETGRLYFQQEEIQYTSAALIGLCDPSDSYEIENARNLTYGDATVAIQEFLKISPVAKDATATLDAND